jgi:hypothetical protein
MSEEDTPLGIPYHRNAPDGHPYINLKLEPERELELPELQKSPILRDLVLTITRGTCLQTFGCEVWLTNRAQSPWPQQPEYSFQAGSYLDLAFTDDRKMSREAYQQLIDDFVKSEISRLRQWSVCNTKRFLTLHKPTGVIWWNWGWGRTRDEAETNWAQGIRLFKEFVLEK